MCLAQYLYTKKYIIKKIEHSISQVSYNQLKICKYRMFIMRNRECAHQKSGDKF